MRRSDSTHSTRSSSCSRSRSPPRVCKLLEPGSSQSPPLTQPRGEDFFEHPRLPEGLDASIGADLQQSRPLRASSSLSESSSPITRITMQRGMAPKLDEDISPTIDWRPDFGFQESPVPVTPASPTASVSPSNASSTSLPNNASCGCPCSLGACDIQNVADVGDDRSRCCCVRCVNPLEDKSCLQPVMPDSTLCRVCAFVSIIPECLCTCEFGCGLRPYFEEPFKQCACQACGFAYGPPPRRCINSILSGILCHECDTQHGDIGVSSSQSCAAVLSCPALTPQQLWDDIENNQRSLSNKIADSLNALDGDKAMVLSYVVPWTSSVSFARIPNGVTVATLTSIFDEAVLQRTECHVNGYKCRPEVTLNHQVIYELRYFP